MVWFVEFSVTIEAVGNTGGDAVAVTVGDEGPEVVWFVGFVGGGAVVETTGDAVVETTGDAVVVTVGEGLELFRFVGFVVGIPHSEEQKPQWLWPI